MSGHSSRDEGSVAGGDHFPNTASMLCFKCGELIPSSSEFCPYCGEALTVDCPKCSFRYPAHFKYCPKCGTNRLEFLKQKDIERNEHEKILQQEEAARREAEEKERARAREREGEVHREIITFVIPESQGGGTESLVLVEQPFHSPRIIWFETLEGKAIISPIESITEDIHYDTVVYYSNGAVGILAYYEGSFYSILDPGEYSVDYFDYWNKAMELTLLENNEKHDTVEYNNNPFGGSGLYKIGDYYYSLDARCYYNSTLERKYDGMSVIGTIVLSLLIGIFGWASVGELMTNLFKANDRLSSTIGIIVSLIAILIFVIWNASQYKTIVSFQRINNNQSDQIEPQFSSRSSSDKRSVVFKVTDLFVSIIEKLRRQEENFGDRDIDYKLSRLEHKITEYHIKDPQVSKIFDLVIHDEDFWRQSDCLDIKKIKEEIMKIYCTN